STAMVCMARKPAGAACTYIGCQPGLHCAGPEGSSVCRGPGQVGDWCPFAVTVERNCALGLVCGGDPSSTSGTCGLRVGEGAACKGSGQCQDGILCVAAADGTAACARPLAEGAACVPLPAFGSGEPGCALGLVCDAASNRCLRLPP